MLNINQSQNLFALDTVQDLDDETAATCNGGRIADIILYKDANLKGEALVVEGGEARTIPPEFNDQFSSVTVNVGLWELYENSNYNANGGRRVTLGYGSWNLPGFFNDKTSSLKRVA